MVLTTKPVSDNRKTSEPLNPPDMGKSFEFISARNKITTEKSIGIENADIF